MVSNDDEWLTSMTYTCSKCKSWRCDIGFWHERKSDGSLKRVKFPDDIQFNGMKW